MRIFIKKSVNNSLQSVSRICTALFFFLFTSVNQILAQEGGPSLKNLRKTGEAIREKQAHDEFMSYVYMIVGFSIVIAIAWISTVKARKRSKEDNEAKLKMIQHNLAHKKTHVNHGHARR